MPGWLLVDGSSLLFRSFFGVPTSIKAPDGRPINAIRGFLDLLARLLAERRPSALAVATDEDWRPQWRVDLVATYKTHRTALPVPLELDPQIPVAYSVLEAIGIPVVRADGHEAEDVIASLVPRLDPPIEIATGDRDLFALVRDPDVVVLYPEGGGVRTLVDEAEVKRRYGIPGRLYGDFAVLRGDPSDGLPGVPGVGPKKAAGLLARYGDLDAIVDAGVLGKAATDYLDRARRASRPVVGLPVEVPAAVLPDRPADPERLVELVDQLGIKSSVNRLLAALGVRVGGGDSPPQASAPRGRES